MHAIRNATVGQIIAALSHQDPDTPFLASDSPAETGHDAFPESFEGFSKDELMPDRVSQIFMCDGVLCVVDKLERR